ncbi:MAG: DUF3885 domain-containing protein [Clostridia bacterium]|nr:DUF3885 domain-containing protein [Clostridia bacterium]
MSADKSIATLITSPDFPYLQPYFYNHPYALRCALGAGSGRVFRRTAFARAREIYRLLFPNGPDAFLFSVQLTDYCTSGAPENGIEGNEAENRRILRDEREQLAFLLDCQARWRHVVVRDLSTYAEPGSDEADRIRRNRVVCYADGKPIPVKELLRRQITERGAHEIGLVSFANDCILSVYDDRGCDVVFASAAKMKAMYPALEPYFLAYDLAEMQRRFAQKEI